jgi:predicted ArsR family transcriptional regulator
VLAEPLRRQLYLHVAAATEPVTRDQAAGALDIGRPVAAFHLDKLVDAGVLAVEYRRPPGRSGPGAGRTAKHYRAVEREFVFTLPERRYEIAAAILAQAVTNAESDGMPIADALRAAARSFGRVIGERAEDFRDAPDGDAMERITAVLIPYGYEPRMTEGKLVLTNCPFHALAEPYRETICRLNLRLLKGVLKGAGATDLVARLDPSDGWCCVTIRCR